MAIYRAPRPDHSFTQIRNDVLRDDRLSYRARGLLAMILSNTDDWATDSVSLARDQDGERRDGVRTALSELEDAGYLVRERRQDARGRWATHSVVYDTPHLDAQPALFPQVTPTTDEPAPVEPTPGEPTPVDPALSRTPSTNTSPTGSGKPPAPAAVIAAAVYDHAQGMVNFMAVRQVAGRAMRVKGATEERVIRIMCQLYDDGKPIILTTVGQALSRGSFRDAGEDHWREGGTF